MKYSRRYYWEYHDEPLGLLWRNGEKPNSSNVQIKFFSYKNQVDSGWCPDRNRFVIRAFRKKPMRNFLCLGWRKSQNMCIKRRPIHYHKRNYNEVKNETT